jgi:hypothetical protein
VMSKTIDHSLNQYLTILDLKKKRHRKVCNSEHEQRQDVRSYNNFEAIDKNHNSSNWLGK